MPFPAQIDYHHTGVPQRREPIPDPARFHWHEVSKVAHYYLSLGEMQR